jgi:Low molecular weight phosphotyrosine protein phosphatase
MRLRPAADSLRRPARPADRRPGKVLPKDCNTAMALSMRLRSSRSCWMMLSRFAIVRDYTHHPRRGILFVCYAGMSYGRAMKRVIFACVHNAGRSQMAAAFFNGLVAPTKAKALSAGTSPAR